jgi:hypothetical protein
MVTKEDVLRVTGKRFEKDFDQFMASRQIMLIGDSIHFHDEDIKKFLEVYYCNERL